MIHIEKDYSRPPKELFSKSIINAVKEAVKNGNANHIQNSHYNPGGKIKDLLQTMYNGKCGYCESKVAHAASLQVEHYRPKKTIDPKDEKSENYGYYWLASEWSNLLLSCPLCNQQGAKGNRFPISGTRIVDHQSFLTNGVIDNQKCFPDRSPLMDEKPLLLNPELCSKPEDHFKYDSDGKVSSKTYEGRTTIEVCRLNRDALITNRKQVIDQVIKIVKIVLVSISQNGNYQIVKNSFKEIFDDLQSSVKPEEEYTLLRKNIYERFSDIILPGINSKLKKIVESAFIAYQNGPL